MNIQKDWRTPLERTGFGLTGGKGFAKGSAFEGHKDDVIVGHPSPPTLLPKSRLPGT